MNVADWLEGIGLGEHVALFDENRIDLEVLPSLTEADLRELGLPLGHRKKLLTAIEALATNAAVRTPDPSTTTQAPAIEAERRQVTILFVDLCGYTTLSSTRDPEEVHRLLSRFFAVADEVVTNYGGTVDKHVGDAVMALFGAPIAHGNDPERAARASAEIHQAMETLSAEFETPLAVHIGIASGQVMASDLGSEAHQEYTVLGDSVNLAARLVELAGPKETFVSDAVQRALTNIARLEHVGEREIRGLDHAVTVWRLSSLGDDARSGGRGPLIGRRAELRQLRGFVEAVLEDGVGQLIYVRGEAGIGKSRLLEEAADMARTAGFADHIGLVLDFGVGKGRDAMRALVRSLLVIAPETDKRTRGSVAEQAVEGGLIAEEQLVFLYDLLDVPHPDHLRAIYDAMDNDRRKRGKQDCVATLVQSVSRERPLFLGIEDLHWADPETLDYLARSARAVIEHPVLLFMTSRVENDPIDQAWRDSAGNAPLATIDLRPLRREESLAFAAEFVDVSNRFASNCVERAEGNPLFLEQLLHSALASEKENVPGSVQSIVLARVDLLPPADKRALQAAAVLGQRFSFDVLRHLVDDESYDGETLIARNLIRPRVGEFLFSHALIWESVYASLLRERRNELHLRAADWFSSVDPSLYAEHLGRADDPRAPVAFLEAARVQTEQLHYEQGLTLVEQGLALAKEPDDRYRLAMQKGECLREIGRPGESIAAYQDALDVAPDDIAQCRARIGLAAGMRVTDDYDAAFAALDEAEAIAHANQLTQELSQVHYYRGNLYFPLGKIDGCLKEHRAALEYAEAAGSPECEVRALSGLGDAYYSRGRMMTSLDYFQRCIARSREQGFGRIAVGNQYMVAWTRLYKNEVAGALEDALDAIQAAERVGHQRAEMVARLTAARIYVEKGNIEAAEPHCAQGLALAESLGANRFKPFLMIYRARIALDRSGADPGALPIGLMQEAYELSKETGIGFLGPWVLCTLALANTDPARSREALSEGEALLKEGCVGHNYFDFYRTAIDISLRDQVWSEAERYADALQAYAAEEPLPWSDFFAARGRALARHGGGARDDDTLSTLSALKAEAVRVGLQSAVPPLAEALAGT
jgi:class 3 adenylate cyclase/tetratricopeptide (TPR) repeat protein